MADPDRLVMVWEENPVRNWHQQAAAPANFLASTSDLRVQGEETFGTEVVHCTADDGYFALMGVPPLAGRMEVFESARQDPRTGWAIVLHTGLPLASILPAVRRTVAQLDPTLALFDVATLDDVYAAALARDRFLLQPLAGFAAVALILALLGVYAVAAEAD